MRPWEINQLTLWQAINLYLADDESAPVAKRDPGEHRRAIFDSICKERKLTPKQLADSPIEVVAEWFKVAAKVDDVPHDKLRQRISEYVIERG